MSNIKLSVIVPTYNHEKYIEECINSILMQKVDFEYEVLIGEDCSTDDTANVLRRIEQRLPSNYYVFYREKNLGVGVDGNVRELQSRARGKYVITIEGDDYLVYEHKLQKQVDFLEENDDVYAVAHYCQVVDENSIRNGEKYPNCKDSEYTIKHYLERVMPGQLATIVYRNTFYDIETFFYEKYMMYDYYPGDRLNAFLMLTQGKYVCMPEEWSAYRHVTSSGTSYSARVKVDKKFKMNEMLFYKSIYSYAKDNNKKEVEIVTGKLYFFSCFKRAIEKDTGISFGKWIKEVFKEKFSGRYIVYILKQTLTSMLNKLKA